MARAHWILAMALVAACDGDDDTGDDDDDDAGDTDTDTTGGDDQIPPQGYAAIDPWLEAGSYTDWNCESAPRSGTIPHGTVRVCSNDLASANGTATEFPVGAASVKELYDEPGTNIVGYAVTSKVSSGGGESWYWYEQVPPGTEIPGVTVDANGVVADGLGDDGQELSVCVFCHAGAPNDYVWVQVP